MDEDGTMPEESSFVNTCDQISGFFARIKKQYCRCRTVGESIRSH